MPSRLPPPPPLAALALIALCGVAPPARAAVDSPDGRVTDLHSDFGTADPDDPDTVWPTWDTGTDDDLSPILTIRTMGWDGMSYRLRGRMHFQGIDYRWTQDLGVQDSFSTINIVLDAGALVAWSDAQSDWTSDLLVQVVVIGPDGRRWSPVTAPYLKVAWTDGSPHLMTKLAAQTAAPHGAWSTAAQAADPLAGEDARTGWFDGEGFDLSTAGR